MRTATATLLEKTTDPGTGEVAYHFENGRTRRFRSDAAALEQMAESLAVVPFVGEVLAVILDQRGVDVAGKRVVVDAAAAELVTVGEPNADIPRPVYTGRTGDGPGSDPEAPKAKGRARGRAKAKE
jgi:hypothetical protein